MITRQFQELTLSALGFGAMRLPQTAEKGIDAQLGGAVPPAGGSGTKAKESCVTWHPCKLMEKS